MKRFLKTCFTLIITIGMLGTISNASQLEQDTKEYNLEPYEKVVIEFNKKHGSTISIPTETQIKEGGLDRDDVYGTITSKSLEEFEAGLLESSKEYNKYTNFESYKNAIRDMEQLRLKNLESDRMSIKLEVENLKTDDIIESITPRAYDQNIIQYNTSLPNITYYLNSTIRVDNNGNSGYESIGRAGTLDVSPFRVQFRTTSTLGSIHSNQIQASVDYYGYYYDIVDRIIVDPSAYGYALIGFKA